MAYCARREKQGSLKECVRGEVKRRRERPTQAERKEHLAELRHRRPSQHPFQIGLCGGDERGRQRGERAQPQHPRKHAGSRFKKRKKAQQQVHARRHHRRGVNKRRNRRRPSHRVRQPGSQRQLGTFAERAEEQEEGGERRSTRRQGFSYRS